MSEHIGEEAVCASVHLQILDFMKFRSREKNKFGLACDLDLLAATFYGFKKSNGDQFKWRDNPVFLENCVSVNIWDV